MRILLINPPRSEKNLIRVYAPEDMQEHVSRNIPIGPPQALCAIAGNLPEFEVDIFDMKAEYDLGLKAGIDEAVVKKMAAFRPDVVGVTLMTSEYNDGCRILKAAKRFDPAVLTIAGGVHASLCPEHCNLPFVDITILGHGKKVFRDIIIEKSKQGEYTSLPNIAVRKDGKHIYTKKMNLFETPEDLLSHVYANRELVRKYGEAYRISRDRYTYGFIETSLGCPNKCTFCSIWPMNKGYYYKRSLEDILGELDTMRDFQLIRFVDANTTGDTGHINAVFDAIIKAGYKNKFMMDIRADTAADCPELMHKAAEAGVSIAIVGVESIDEEELKRYNKECSVEKILKAIEAFHRNKIDMRASFIIQPDYTEKDFERLSRFVNENDLKHASFPVMTPIPGTPMYPRYKDSILIKDLDYYNFYNSVLPTKLPTEEFYRRIADLCRGKATIT